MHLDVDQTFHENFQTFLGFILFIQSFIHLLEGFIYILFMRSKYFYFDSLYTTLSMELFLWFLEFWDIIFMV